MKQKQIPINEDINIPTYEEILNPQKRTFPRTVDLLTCPILAIAMHFFIIGFWGKAIFFETNKKNIEEIEVYMKNIDIKEFKEPREIPINEDKKDDNDESVNFEPDDVKVDDIEIKNIEIKDIKDMDEVGVMKINKSNLSLKGTIAMRANSQSRLKMIKKYNTGNGANSNKINIRTSLALKWLAENQNNNGSWGIGNARYESIIALSSLATLAFLAHGETPDSERFGNTILKAIKFLVYSVTKRKLSENINPQHNWIVEGGDRGYGNGMLGYALAEAYNVTKIPMIKNAMNKQISCIIKAQNEQGSWNYNYLKKMKYLKTPQETRGKKISDPKGDIIARSDLSLAGWHYQALKAALSAGCANKNLQKAIDKSILSLKSYSYIGNGCWGYSNTSLTSEQTEKFNEGHSFSMSSVGILCLQLFGEGDCPQVKKGMNYLTKTNPKWLSCDWEEVGNVIIGKKNTNYLDEETAVWSLYAWYYYTQAIFQGEQGKGANWKKWNSSFSKELIKQQNADGYWISPVHKYTYQGIGTLGEHSYIFYSDKVKKSISRGSFASKSAKEPTSEASKDLKIYSTALCTLMLTVYYRYLPSSESNITKEKSIKYYVNDDIGLFFE